MPVSYINLEQRSNPVANGSYSQKNAHLVYIGLVIVNICATYFAGGLGIYAATAFREYGRIDLFNLIFVIEPLVRSLALLISGRSGEHFGRKKLYLWSVSGFSLTVVICMVASDGITFLIARSLSGFFWGLFLTNVFAIVNDVFPKEEYPVRIGILQTVNSLIFIVGPIICGVIIEDWNWRISLGVMLPAIVIGLLLVEFFMPRMPRRKGTHEKSAVKNSGSASKKRRACQPFESIKLGALLNQDGFAVLILIISVYTFVYCTGNYIPLYAQTELKTGVALSAMVLVPCNIMGMLFSSLSGMYIAKKGCSKKLLLMMSGAALCGSLLYILSAVEPGFFIITLATAILCIGAGIYQVMPFSFVQKYLKKDLMAEGTSLIGFVEGIASVIAGFIYSATMINGIAFGLASASIFGVLVFILTILKYRVPNSGFQSKRRKNKNK